MKMTKMNEIVIKIDANLQKVEEKRILAYEDVLKEIGFGRVQIELLIACFLVLLNVMNETMGISYILPVAQCDMGLSESDKGLLSGIIFIAMIIPSYGWGLIAGSYGRRFVILWTVLGSTIFTCLGAFFTNFALFLTCRFFSGLFVAGYSAVVYTYIGEFCIKKHRSIIISWASVSVGIGMIIMPLTAFFILSNNWRFGILKEWSFASWRLLLIIYTIPGIIGSLWLLKMPESPKFLLTVNRKDNAHEIVKWIHTKNSRKSKDLDVDGLKSEASDDLIEIKELKGLKKMLISMKDQTVPLLKPPHLLYFSVCCAIQFGIFCIAGGFALFLPDTLNKIAHIYESYPSEKFRICEILARGNSTIFSHEQSCHSCVNSKVFIDSMFLGVAFTIAYITLSLFMKPKRRKIIIAFTLFTSGMSGILLSYSQSQYTTIISMCLFIMLSGINSAILNGVACDIFPTKQLSIVVCIMMIFGRVGTASLSSLLAYLFEHNCELAFYILPGITLLCFILSFILPS